MKKQFVVRIRRVRNNSPIGRNWSYVVKGEKNRKYAIGAYSGYNQEGERKLMVFNSEVEAEKEMKETFDLEFYEYRVGIK